MRGMKTLLVGASIAAVVTQVMAGQYKSSDISSDAKWVVHADLAQLRATQFGGHLLEKMRSEDAQNRFAAFQAIFNFDPRTDLDGLTLYGYGKTKQKDGVLIAKGRFDGERLVTLVKANETYEPHSLGGFTVHSWIDKKEAAKAAVQGCDPKRSYGCVYADGVILISDSCENVGKAIEVLAGRATSLQQENPLGIQPPAAGFLTATAITSKMKNVDPKAAILKRANGLSLSLGEVDGLMSGTFVLDAHDARAVTNLKKIVDGMIGLALLNEETNPGAAKLAEAASVQLTGTRLQITLAAPVEDMIRCAEEKAAQKKRP